MKQDKPAAKSVKKRASATEPALKEALRKSEESYHVLFNTIRQAIYIQDPEGRFVEVNDGACAMYGYAREDFIGRTPEFLAAPGLNDFCYVSEKIRQAFAGEPQSFEFWACRRNKEIFPKDVNVCKGTYAGNDVVIAVATDISEKKRTEKALFESGEYYRAIINTSPDNITITDLHGTILMGSAASVAMFGLPDAAAANGRKILEFIVPEERERARQAFASIVTTEVALGNYHGIRNDGSVFPFEAHISLMRDRHGNPWRLVSIVRDISQRRQLEVSLSCALARSKNQQQVIAEISASPLVSLGEVDELARMITSLAAPLLGVERAGVWLFDDAETLLTCIDLFTSTPGRHTSGPILRETEFRNEFAALRSARFINADDPLTDPRTAGYVEGYLKPLKITSMLDAVIRSFGKTIGLICFEHVEKQHTWDPDECTFACQLADQIALAVTNRERKTVQEALVKSEERYQSFISNSNEGIFRFEAGFPIPADLPADEQIALFVRHGYLAECNDAYARMFGYDNAEEILDASISRMIAMDNDITMDYMRTFIRSGYRIENYETEEKDRQGSSRWFSNNLTGFIRDGKVIRLWGVQRDITEQKNAGRQLAESEAKFRFLTERMNDIVWMSDLRFRTTYVSPSIERVLGFTPEERISQEVTDQLTPESLTFVQTLLAQELESEAHSPCDLERTITASLEYYHKNGSTCWLECLISTIRNENGVLTGIHGVSRDITGRRKAEEALRESEELFRMVFHNANDAVFLHELTGEGPGNYLLVNDVALSWLGYTREELLGMSPRDIVPEEIGQKVIPKIMDILSKGGHATFESLHQRKDKSTYPVEVSTHIFPFGRRTVALSIARDITRRKQGTDALRESELRYRHLIEAVTDYVFTVRVQDGSAAGTVHGPGCEAVTGYTPEDFHRDPGLWLRMVLEDDRAAVTVQAKTVLSGETVQALEHRILHKDGRVIWVRNTPVPHRDASGTLIAYDGMIQDVTDRKRAELALVKSEAQLNAIIRASPVPMFVINDHHGVISWNRALENTTGISSEKVLGTNLHWKAFYQSQRPCLADLLLDCSLEQIPDLYTDKFQKSAIADGAYEVTDFFPHMGEGGKWLHFMAAPITDSDGVVIGAVETLENITGLVRAQEELKESEARYSALFSNNYSVSLLIDPDTGRIVDANDAAGRYYGYPLDQLRRMGIFDLNRLSQDLVVRNLMRAKDEKAKHFYSTHYRADGEMRYVEVYSGPIRVQGKLLFYSIIHDITDSRLAEQELKESEERYRTLVDQLPDYVLVHRDGILLYVNPAAALHLGYDSEMLVSKPMLTFVAPECHDRVRQAVLLRMGGGDVSPYEVKIVTRDGSYRTVLVHGAMIRYGNAPASLNVLADITPLKRAEKDIRSANEELEKRVKDRTEDLSRANEQLTAEIAARTLAEREVVRSLHEKDLLLREIHHRVKNNLQIIASLLKLQSRYITDPNVLEAIKSSQSRIRAMALVHERIYRSHNIAEINLKDYLNYLTKQIFQFYNVQLHQIGLNVTMDDILEDIDTITPLGLIINELVSNSLKYAFPEGRKGSISIGCTQPDAGTLRIVYHDTGAGMPAGFDWKNSESLGLRLVNSLVDQLDGTIETGGGEGTTFIITINKKRDPHHS